jgi:hypothetical protein
VGRELSELQAIRRSGRPSPVELGDRAEAWLAHLGTAARFDIAGRDRSRCRAIVTLLHGNEPSGTRALREWLALGEQPAADLHCFVMGVEIALASPGFHHRKLPGQRDLNRCFLDGPKTPDDTPGRLANTLLTQLKQLRPEAIIDLHNTSGESPAYGVTTRVDTARLSLTSLFASHMIKTDIALGSLMEGAADFCPVVTIECGGAADRAADRVAFEGISRFARADEPTQLGDRLSPVILRNPVRVELAAGARVAYADTKQDGVDITLKTDVDRHNFDPVLPGEVLGWLGKRGLAGLCVQSGNGDNITADLFDTQEGKLKPRVPLELLMVTTRVEIAESDCLFYAVPVEPAGATSSVGQSDEHDVA